MSESDSASESLPSDATLEQALKDTVRKIYETQKLEDFTVKRVRAAAEEQLGLQKDFFRNHHLWKDRSKEVIQAEVDAHPGSSQASPPKKPQARKLPKESKNDAAKSQSKAKDPKRSSKGDAGPKKRRKTEESVTNISSSEGQHVREEHAGVESKQSKTPLSSPAPEYNNGTERPKPNGEGVTVANDGDALDSGSEMSVLIDEDPKPKAKRRSAGAELPKPKKAGTSKASKPDSQADPDAEEIKRLQGWLVKCGIRKMWYKELQPYDTPKAKIRHLKEMLSDAGMTGRYSADKAAQIKEERELKADLEAVQAGNKHWGKAGSEDEGPGRPKRRLARGLENLDFLNDDDGEETD